MAALASMAAGPSACGQEKKPDTPIDRQTLEAALRVMGLEYSPAQIEQAVPRVNQLAGRIQRLRKIEVPLDTEPAARFHALGPGPMPRRRAVFQPSRVAPVVKPKNEGDLAFLPVTRLAWLLRNRRITSRQLTAIYLERLKQFGPRLNCVITLTGDLAMEQAARADQAIRAGKYRGPLHGIPWGAKDLLATKGIATTWGAEPYRDQVPSSNATVVDRLEKAGAVLVAKLSMGALAMGGLWFGGMTKTPWNVEESSSGSSAGSASAAAAGLVAFAIGTETLGSIVSPCVRCGVAGVRPTYGRVPRTGAMALSWTMDKIGPICRTVEDCALVLRAIHGPDGRDGTAIDAPLEWNPARPLSTLRIGMLEEEFGEADAKDKPVYEAALAGLGKAGARLRPVKLPDFDVGALLLILSAEGAAAFDDLTRSGGLDRLTDQGPDAWPNTFRGSRFIPAVEYIRAQRARTLMMRRMELFFKDWDVLVSPPGDSLGVTNLTGHPQVVVPCGFVDGMPRGLVFTAGLCEEGAAMRVAHAYERATRWHAMRPPVS